MAGSALLMVGCDPGPACAQWITTYHLQPYKIGKSTAYHTVPTMTCIRYEETDR